MISLALTGGLLSIMAFRYRSNKSKDFYIKKDFVLIMAVSIFVSAMAISDMKVDGRSIEKARAEEIKKTEKAKQAEEKEKEEKQAKKAEEAPITEEN